MSRWKCWMAVQQARHVGRRALLPAQQAVVHQPAPVHHVLDHQARREYPMITKYLAIFRTKCTGKAKGGWVPGHQGKAFFLHVPSLRFYIRVGKLQ